MTKTYQAEHNILSKSQEELEKYWGQQQDEFVGYVWMSDDSLEEKNKLVHPQKLPSWQELHRNNNFIWECNLYAKGKTSISIRQVNDSWLVSETLWNKGETVTDFIDHAIFGTGFQEKLHFVEAWLPKEDILCEDSSGKGMPVLTPAWVAFCGFKSN